MVFNGGRRGVVGYLKGGRGQEPEEKGDSLNIPMTSHGQSDTVIPGPGGGIGISVGVTGPVAIAVSSEAGPHRYPKRCGRRFGPAQQPWRRW